jgi:Na+/H+ antiporter NhaD/arsenite permease-like protein
VMFFGGFLFFLGVVQVTQEYQERLALREGLLVGFFLGGLVILGGLQGWWLTPVLANLGELPLFLGTTGLTAFTDNAALTYLGSQVEGLSEGMKYALVAGAVAGGGLTVIANAPNPAGMGILKNSFDAEGISPVGLLLSAIGPTIVAMLALWLLPSF